MISYEKVRQSLRSTTFGLAIYHLLGLVLTLIVFAFGIWFALTHKEELAQITAEMPQAEATPLSAFMGLYSILSLIVSIALMILHFSNVKKLDQKIVPSPLAYYLGLGHTIFGIILSFIAAPTYSNSNIASSLIGNAIPTIALIAYAYATYKYNIYRHKDDDKADSE